MAGVAINDDGSIIVAGSTHNGALNAGAITTAYTGGEEGFVANLSADLTPSASDTLAYYAGSGGDVRVTAVTAAGGQAYIGGQVVNTTGGTTSYDGFAAQIDPTTGASGWSNQYTGLDQKVAPNAIAVDASGASVLDALGLPSGQIDFSRSQTVAASTLPGAANSLIPAQTLVANSALRAGEQFTVKTNFSGVAQTVTIEATDTLQTLAQKISQASGFSAGLTVTTVNGAQVLQIKPNYPGVQITLGAAKERSQRPAGPRPGRSAPVTTNATAKAAKARRDHERRQRQFAAGQLRLAAALDPQPVDTGRRQTGAGRAGRRHGHDQADLLRHDDAAVDDTHRRQHRLSPRLPHRRDRQLQGRPRPFAVQLRLGPSLPRLPSRHGWGR